MGNCVAGSPESEINREDTTVTGLLYERTKSTSPTHTIQSTSSNGDISKQQSNQQLQQLQQQQQQQPSPQASSQGALTIVRRSNSRKNNLTLQQAIQDQEKDESLKSTELISSDRTVAPYTFSNSEIFESMSMQSLQTDDLDNVDLATENLPAVDTPDACDKAATRLRCLLRLLQRGEIPAEILQKNLHYAARVLEAVYIDETERLADEDDELSEVQPDAVPPEVREWLASTFARQLGTTRKRSDERPKFRSVAHAIRAGIFVDRIYRRVSSTTLMQFPSDVVKVLKTLDDWTFDVFALADAANGQPVKYLGYDLLNRYGMIHKFKVAPATLEQFLVKIEEGYCRFRNPYHNNLHAADVAQTVHHILCQTGLMHWLSDLEIFAMLLAALIHDYEHTGTTNDFHVMSGSETAMLYNDRAVLENHHVSAAFRVLKDDDSNVLANLSREEYRELRSLIIDMVLATDMSYHFQQLKNMKNLLTLAEPAIDKSKALALVLHCCDISHPAKRWNIHHRWTMLLLEEFFRQGDLEREMGLPFSPLCDRNNTLVAQSQIGFIDFIVEPSMSVCSDLLEYILAPIAPLTAPKQEGGTSKDSELISCIREEEQGQTVTETTEKSPSKFTIRKPWVVCLTENRKIWKEQDIKDAEQRQLTEQAQQDTDKENSTES